MRSADSTRGGLIPLVQLNFSTLIRTFLLAALIVAATQISTSAAGITEPLELVNETGQPIMSLYFVPIQKKNWGNDLVGSGVMNQGDRRSIHYDTEYTHYKVKVEFADGTSLTAKDVDLLDVWRLSINRVGAALRFDKNTRG